VGNPITAKTRRSTAITAKILFNTRSTGTPRAPRKNKFESESLLFRRLKNRCRFQNRFSTGFAFDLPGALGVLAVKRFVSFSSGH
jgi:hypothetical protein